MVLLTIAGDQVPVMPLDEIPGNAGAGAPLQMGGITAKVGVTLLTVTVRVVFVAHCPVVGVKVYVPVAVLLTVAGLHVPVIPLVEVVGSTGAADPLHMGGTAAKEGTVLEPVTVTAILVGFAHCPAVGVNV